MPRFVWLGIGLVLGAVAGFVAGVGLSTTSTGLSTTPTALPPAPAETHSISGSYLLGAYDGDERNYQVCTAIKPPSGDIAVTDENGQTIGMARMAWDKGTIGSIPDKGSYCAFAFTIQGVPRRAFYSIGIHGQKGVLFSYEEMETLNWTVGLQAFR